MVRDKDRELIGYEKDREERVARGRWGVPAGRRVSYEEISAKIKSGSRDLDHYSVAKCLGALAEQGDEDSFTGLVFLYSDYLTKEDPTTRPISKGRSTPSGFSTRSSALRFVEYCCKIADHGLSKIVHSNGVELPIGRTQKLFYKVTQISR